MVTSSMPLLTVKNLSLQRGSTTLFGGMDLAIEAGLNAITGDEGVGKTALLHYLAGDLTDASGDRVGPNAFFVAPPDEVALQLTPLQRWELLAKGAPLWKQTLCEDLYHALGLAEHLHKKLFMLSTGTRKKVDIIAALSAGATITCIDQPYAGLDKASIDVLRDFFHSVGETASLTQRAWVIADYAADATLNWDQHMTLKPVSALEGPPR